MAASINDLTSPAGQASAAVDVVRAFLDVATAVGGRATFYNMERAPSVAYWDTLWAPLLRGCYGAEMVRRQQAGAPARPLATRVPLDTAGTGSLEELADALDAADRAERRRTRDRITRGGARTRRSWPTTLATATWTERGWRPLLVSGLWASSSAAAAGSCTRRWSRGRVSRDPCSRVMAGVAFPEGSLGGARVVLPAEQRGRDPAGAGSGRRPADREGQAFVLLAYPGLLAASAQIVDVWQAHADGDHVEIFVTDDPGYVAGLGDNDPEAEVDPVPFLDRDGVAPNGMINGRERLVPGDRLLWLGATDGTAECTAVLFETSCHCQVIGRTWNPEVLARRRSLLLHALTLDEPPAAMIGPTRRALALPVPRVWAPRHPDASNGWARVDAKPPPTAYWLPQLHSVGRDARASGTGRSPGPW